MNTQTPLVILDRDGTLNVDDQAFITSADAWSPVPGALEAVAKLNEAGWRVVVASNQSGLGRGLFDMATLNEVHAKMHKMLAAVGARVDAVFFCPHTLDDNCDCRKPLPGLITRIVERFAATPAKVPVAGNTVRHMQAAHAAGAQPHLLLVGKCAQYTTQHLPEGLPAGTQVHVDLHAFVDYLLANSSGGANA
ncbi:MAG: D-glycero-beta-D-manno-heptose 1,7-bisphosphate 7-phosphatase [Burkholderiaceae bacterium]|jgi:D-glycero-D-manno-heptose 1,7-bisphosphate phosphatase|nr:D-glycero-beta-D-manno-heptose 1,7-bisphosphate 7-phosphatase [Burkholderiaceae bacterium]